jgi:hypothetical protein
VCRITGFPGTRRRLYQAFLAGSSREKGYISCIGSKPDRRTVLNLDLCNNVASLKLGALISITRNAEVAVRSKAASLDKIYIIISFSHILLHNANIINCFRFGIDISGSKSDYKTESVILALFLLGLSMSDLIVLLAELGDH